MFRSAALTVVLSVISVLPTATQTPPKDPPTLQAILAELRSLRHDLQTTSAMAARVQIAIHRFQLQNEAVVRSAQRVSDARQRVAELEEARRHKAQEVEQSRVAASSNEPNAQQESEEELEFLRRQEQQARVEQEEAQRQLRDEQVRLRDLNDLLDRYNKALEDVGRGERPREGGFTQ